MVQFCLTTPSAPLSPSIGAAWRMPITIITRDTTIARSPTTDNTPVLLLLSLSVILGTSFVEVNQAIL